MADPAIELFFSYAHEDESFKDELLKHLQILKRRGTINLWHDRMIPAGSEWDHEIKQSLNTADIILLLVSPDFLNSDYAWDVEVDRALKRHETGEACVIPVILRIAGWDTTPFGKLQALPTDAKAITKWDDRDEAFDNVRKGIERAVKQLQKRRQAKPQLVAPQPRPETINATSNATSENKFPSGWTEIKLPDLLQCAEKLTAAAITHYFDGCDPRWEEAMSPIIQPRTIVETFTDILIRNQNRGLHLALLLGSGGEGKSTALRQIVCKLVKDAAGFRILWWEDADLSKVREVISGLDPLKENERWLIVCDDPSRQVFEKIHSLFTSPLVRQDFQFLLCCRSTIWQSSGNPLRKDRMLTARLTKRTMPPLERKEAEKIVRAWKDSGGLPSGKSETAAVEELLNKQDSNKAVLLAAMLQVRNNETLEERVERILSDFSNQPNSEFILDAYACIAAIHAEGLKFLLKENVLAEAIRYKPKQLRSDILDKHADEIIRINEDCPILTRHQTIAETAVKILERDPYCKDFEQDIFPRLAVAAQRLRNSLKTTELQAWQYAFPKHFAEDSINRRISLAIRIAEAIYEVNQTLYLFTHLAQFYRKGDQLPKVIQLFRESAFDERERDRKFYSEWATAEREIGQFEVAAWLYAIALADETPRYSPSQENGMVNLSGMGFAFFHLHEQYERHQNDGVFAQALGASAQLGLTIAKLANYRDKQRTVEDLQKNRDRARELGIQDVTPNIAMEKLEQGIQNAYQKVLNLEERLPNWVKEKCGSFRFQALKKLLDLD